MKKLLNICLFVWCSSLFCMESDNTNDKFYTSDKVKKTFVYNGSYKESIKDITYLKTLQNYWPSFIRHLCGSVFVGPQKLNTDVEGPKRLKNCGIVMGLLVIDKRLQWAEEEKFENTSAQAVGWKKDDFKQTLNDVTQNESIEKDESDAIYKDLNAITKLTSSRVPSDQWYYHHPLICDGARDHRILDQTCSYYTCSADNFFQYAQLLLNGGTKKKTTNANFDKDITFPPDALKNAKALLVQVLKEKESCNPEYKHKREYAEDMFYGPEKTRSNIWEERVRAEDTKISLELFEKRCQLYASNDLKNVLLSLISLNIAGRKLNSAQMRWERSAIIDKALEIVRTQYNSYLSPQNVVHNSRRRLTYREKEERQNRLGETTYNASECIANYNGEEIEDDAERFFPDYDDAERVRDLWKHRAEKERQDRGGRNFIIRKTQHPIDQDDSMQSSSSDEEDTKKEENTDFLNPNKKDEIDWSNAIEEDINNIPTQAQWIEMLKTEDGQKKQHTSDEDFFNGHILNSIPTSGVVHQARSKEQWETLWANEEQQEFLRAKNDGLFDNSGDFTQSSQQFFSNSNNASNSQLPQQMFTPPIDPLTLCQIKTVERPKKNKTPYYLAGAGIAGITCYGIYHFWPQISSWSDSVKNTFISHYDNAQQQ